MFNKSRALIPFFNPLLIALMPLFQSAAHNYLYIKYDDFFKVFAIIVASCAVVFLFLLCVQRNVKKTLYFCTVLFSVLLIAPYTYRFFSLGVAADIYKYIQIPYLFEYTYGIINCLSWLALSYLTYTLSYKALANNEKFSAFVFIFVCAFMVQQLPPLLKVHAYEKPSFVYDDVEKFYAGADALTKPNIVYIVPDRYASNHNLEKYYRFDNSDFVSFLKEKNFKVSESQYSNYTKTFASLASALNMGYLDSALHSIDKNVNSYSPVFDFLQDNQSTRLLKKLDYRYVNMGNWWQPTKDMKYADKNVVLNPLYSEFMSSYISNTPFDFVNYFINPKVSSVEACALFEKQSETVDQEIRSSSDRPVFIFWHMFLTHEPFIFNTDGTCAAHPYWADRSWKERQETYLSHLKITNGILKSKIEFIQSQSRRPTIIVVQADEGPLPWEILQNKTDYNYWNAPEEVIKLKHGMFNAIYLPSENYKDFSAQMSPINNFRIIFNELYESRLPYLPHRFYDLKSEKEPLKLKDITPIIKNPERLQENK